MELGVYSLFQVDIRNLVRNRIYILKGCGLQPDVYASWPFYEYEFFIEDLNAYIEEENKRQEEQEKGQSGGSLSQNSLMKEAKGMMSGFKIPSMPKM